MMTRLWTTMRSWLLVLGLGLLCGFTPVTRDQAVVLTGQGVPSLDLNFAAMTPASLPSYVSFSRPSLATQFDSTGKLVYASNNQVVSSIVGATGWGVRINYSVALNAGPDPFGGNAASLITNSGDITPTEGLFSDIATSQFSSYVISVYLKAGTTTSARLVIKQKGTDSVAAQTGVLLTSSWQRYSLAAQANGVRFELGTDGTAGTIFAAGAMIEQRLSATDTNAGTYVATSGSAYYAPRFDYDPVTLQARGLRIEEQRTNLLLQSNQFDTSWATTRATVSSAAAVSPDGASDAWKLVAASGTSPDHLMIQNVGKAASAQTYAFSVFAKPAELGRVNLTLQAASNGVQGGCDLSGGQVAYQASAFGIGWTQGTVTISPAGNGFYRCTLTATTDTSTTLTSMIKLDNGSGTNAPALSFTGDGVSGIYIYGAQTELASFSTSYVPTTTAAVTRSADVATVAKSTFSYSSSGGTFAVDFVMGGNPSFGAIAGLDDGADTNKVALALSGGGKLSLGVITSGTGGGSLQDPTLALSVVSGAFHKAGVAWRSGYARAALDGTLSGTTLTPAGTFGMTQVDLGKDGLNRYANAWLKRFRYWPLALPEWQLQQKTSALAPANDNLSRMVA